MATVLEILTPLGLASLGAFCYLLPVLVTLAVRRII